MDLASSFTNLVCLLFRHLLVVNLEGGAKVPKRQDKENPANQNLDFGCTRDIDGQKSNSIPELKCLSNNQKREKNHTGGPVN
eukprot:12065_2